MLLLDDVYMGRNNSEWIKTTWAELVMGRNNLGRTGDGANRPAS